MKNKKVNIKTIDKVDGTITLVMDMETYEDHKTKREHKALEDGFNKALFAMKDFMEKKNYEDWTEKKFKESCNSSGYYDGTENCNFFYIKMIKDIIDLKK